MEITPSAIFHPQQPFPANFFVTHGALLIDNPVHRGNLLAAHSSSLLRLPQGLP
jgi:hypothetical protein